MRSWELIQFIGQPFRQPHPLYPPTQHDGAAPVEDGHEAANVCDGANGVCGFQDVSWTRAIREVEYAHNLGKGLPVGEAAQYRW